MMVGFRNLCDFTHNHIIFYVMNYISDYMKSIIRKLKPFSLIPSATFVGYYQFVTISGVLVG